VSWKRSCPRLASRLCHFRCCEVIHCRSRVQGRGSESPQANRGRSSAGRAPALQAGGRRFESARLHNRRSCAIFRSRTLREGCGTPYGHPLTGRRRTGWSSQIASQIASWTLAASSASRSRSRSRSGRGTCRTGPSRPTLEAVALFTGFVRSAGMPTEVSSITREHVEAFLASELERVSGPSSRVHRALPVRVRGRGASA
jgi:hypothetical protein